MKERMTAPFGVAKNKEEGQLQVYLQDGPLFYFLVVPIRHTLFQPPDYAKTTLKVFAELFTKSDKKHRSKKKHNK